MIWLAMLVCVLLALAFVLLPLTRARAEGAANPHDRVVLQLYEQRIGEIEEEVEDPHMRQQMRDEMGAVLVSEVADMDASAKPAPTPGGTHNITSPGLPQIVGLVLMVPLLALLLHLWVADPGVVLVQGAEQVMQLSAEQHSSELEDWRERLNQRVAQAADDHKSWYLLGHAELKLANYAAAAAAFASTNELAEGDMTVLVYWLQSRYLAARGELDAVSRDIAAQVLKNNPNMPVVLEILAVDEFRQGRHGAAVSLLNRAISGTQNPAQQASFAAAIRQVRNAITPAPVGVEVAASSSQQVPHNATLFVIARPVGGGMPFAVVRRPAALLPLTVQLDDLVSMSPDRLLSSAEEFEVVVRISRSGTAMPAADDWQWVSPVQSLSAARAAPVKLEAQLQPPS